MSDDSLESVEVTTESTPSEPVNDTKQDAVEVEEEVEAEPETKAEVEEKKLSKYEQEVELHGKTKHGMQKRLDRITAKSKADFERMATLEAQVKELTPAVVNSAPNEKDFESYDEWQDAIVDHKVKEKVDAERLADKQGQLDTANKIRNDKVEKVLLERVHAFRVDNPDYTSNSEAFAEQTNMIVREKGNDNPTVSAINSLLMESELAPNLINELGSKPEFMEELADMSPMNAIRELIKLENSYGSSTQETKPLPKPIKGIKGKGSPSKSLDSCSPSDLMSRLGL